MARPKKLYYVNWLRNGFCYRTTHSVPREELAKLKRIAKALGETLKIEEM